MPVASSSRKAQRQPRTWNQVTIDDKETNVRLETEDGCNSLILIKSLKLYHSEGRFVFHAHFPGFCSTQQSLSKFCMRRYLTADNNTTVGVEGLSSNGGAVRRSQEDKASGNLRRLRGAANGAGELALGFFVHGGRDQRSPDGTGGDCVDADTATDILVVQTTSEGDDGALC